MQQDVEVNTSNVVFAEVKNSANVKIIVGYSIFLVPISRGP